MMNNREVNKLHCALTLAAEHFEALAVILACPMTAQEQEIAYQQAEKSAEICRKAINKLK